MNTSEISGKDTLFATLVALIPIGLLFLRTYTTTIGLSFFSPLCNAIFALSIVYIICTSITSYSRNNDSKSLLLLFVIHSLYCIYYTYVSPQIARIDMANLLTDFGIQQALLYEFLVIVINGKLAANINYQLLAKSYVVINTLLVPLYFKDTYMFYKELNVGLIRMDAFNELGLLSALGLGIFSGMTIISAFYLRHSWTKSKFWNKMIFYAIIIVNSATFVITAKRGAFIFMIVVIIFYQFAKKKIFQKLFMSLSVFLLIWLLFGDMILDIFSTISPALVERLQSMGEDGGSGRFGRDDSIYSLAIKQILTNPLFGSYFRMTASGAEYGGYPHNIILECLMTFGIFFSFFLFRLFYKAIRNTYYAIKYDSPASIIGLYFCYIFMSLFTSGSLFCNIEFWTSFAIILSLSPEVLKSHQ